MTIPQARNPDPLHDDRLVRLGCGHMGVADGDCDDCKDLGDSPDPWLLAGGDVNPNRQAETRAYRQSKGRT